jgi:rfaE bifunctional protein kinase chain/domain
MTESERIRRFRTCRVVVLGDIVADEYIYGETDRVSREAPVLIVRHESSETKLGGAANAAANVAALGGSVIPVGVVGQDTPGREVLRQFRLLGADTSGIVMVANRCTETKTRILAGGRSTTRQQMLRLDKSADEPLSAATRRRLLARIHAAARSAGALVVSDYGSGLIDPEMIELIRDVAQRIPVCVDSRYGISAFRGVTLAKPNEPELEAMIGGRLRTEADLERAGRALLQRLETRALIVTRGRRGMSLFQPDRETVHIPVWGPSEAVDVTGAGDTVLATLALALAAGAAMAEAAKLANIAAGIVVQKPGTATCSQAELLQAVGARPATGRRYATSQRAALRPRSARGRR